ncbi:undecaprenyl-phosphate glucose phosphotransferase [Clostridium algidicarnis]|uniref:undecaprenyl-phosphate glucose phosphotransferase n=1 Tax=Clostridium algidicarnis TaxID=37659 RepID=UPI001C0E13CD|nr:undecaprenyl-phosphate glucose phosphotransferase [Clostridium algidicarnis]MBU3197396.1 undecaprenyl-phosphate glucose phosphotransferase [Clostridium algidicarnis]
MIKKNQQIFNKTLVILDALGILVSFFIAWYIRIKSGLIDLEMGYLTLREYFIPVLIMIPIYIIIYNFNKLYEVHRLKFLTEEMGNVIVSNVVGIMCFTMVLFLFKQVHYSRVLLLIFAITSTIVASLERALIRLTLREFRKKGYNKKHIIFIGYSNLTEKFMSLINKNKHWGYNVVGVFSDNKVIVEECTMDYLGRIKDIERYLLKNRDIDEVYITLEVRDYYKLKDIIRVCENVGVRTQIIPDYYKYIPAKPYVEEVEGLPIINLRYIPLDNIFNKFIKRFIDITLSILAIIFFSPIMIIIVVLIKLTSPGPVIFKQERVGLNRRNFIMYKFRSMEIQNEEEEITKWTVKNDNRKTKIGSFIRKTSLDELPQIFNVLKGDMSLIGPRPERPYFVDKFKDEIPKYMVKHQVRPGMTGWAQVNGWRGDTSIEKRIECDIYYIENWSLLMDVKIIFKTIFKGFFSRNAY